MRALICADSFEVLDRVSLAEPRLLLPTNGNALTSKAVLKIKWVTLKSAYHLHKVTGREQVSPVSIAIKYLTSFFVFFNKKHLC